MHGYSLDLDQPLENALSQLLAHYAPTARLDRLRWSGGETAVLELGQGDPLLLVHGALSDISAWAPILTPLATRHRVIAINLPGHGLADSFDFGRVDLLDHARIFLREVLDRLDLASVDVVANSLGGLYATAFGLAAPERLRQLVLLGAPVGIVRSLPLELRLLCMPLIGQRLARTMLSNPKLDATRQFWGSILVAHPERLDDAVLAVDIASTRRNLESYLSLLRCLGTVRGLPAHLLLHHRWRALTVPTLLLWGERDAFVHPRVGAAVAATNPYIRFVQLLDSGHLPWFDEPGRVVSEVEHHLGVPRSGSAQGAAATIGPDRSVVRHDSPR